MGRPRYRITFQPLRHHLPIWVRIRRFLKCSLRTFGLQCLQFEELPPEEVRTSVPAEKVA